MTSQTQQTQHSHNSYKAEKVGDGTLCACYHCHKQGHRYEEWYKANEDEKQAIRNRIQEYRKQHQYKHKNNTNRRSLNSLVATPNTQEMRL